MEQEIVDCTSPVIDTINAGDILQAVKHSMDSTFAKHVDPIIGFAENIPAYSGNILEWGLDNKEGCFDFAYRVNADFDGTLLKTDPMPNAGAFNEDYQYLINETQNAFRLGIENVWIEYDFPFGDDPALFFDIHRESNICLEEKVKSVHQVSRLFSFDLQPALFEFLKKINRQGLAVVYYGWMFSRQSKAIRLTINGIQPDKLTDTLIWLGWEGNYCALKNLQKKYLNDLQQIVLAVDFDRWLSPRIGIEVFDKKAVQFIELLYNNKIIDIQQLSLLSQWPGKFELRPAAASALSNLHQRNISQVYRRVNHFKFILDRSDLITAKAYLYYCF